MSDKRRNWTRDEVIIALYLYFTIPFNKVNKFHPLIREYAALIGRTPSALTMKIGNLGSFDKTLREKNIGGLPNASQLDENVWNEFEGKWSLLNEIYQKVVDQFLKQSQKVPDASFVPGYNAFHGKEEKREVNVRVNQSFFRDSVLAAYNYRCCITGIDIPELLIASHIKPWKDDVENRLNPQNGLCLNALHDKAFDRGLFTLDENFRVILSHQLCSSENAMQWFKPYENKEIILPERLTPSLDFLRFHRENIFRG
ncbi:HNH endonuclease [Aggregatibacter kilianii]|uniref:HNH endonuclease n=1 Tax=Aggregatibacter kilianii TaxID=2025884 RepID=UPI000D659CD9|nr:HNH endonuclease [Aggregatibacter kilianii]